jgi:hypothetical protein
MSQRLSGINPLSYIGVEPYTPPGFYIRNRPPTVSDLPNYNIGALWDYTYTRPSDQVVVSALWMLVAANGGVATWIQLYPALNVGALTFDTDAANAIPAAGVVHIAGGTNINTSGATDVVTINLDNNIDITGPLTVSGLGAGVVQSSAGGLLSSSEGTDGQLLIGSSAGIPEWANIIAGANVTVTNGHNSITIASTGGGGGGTTGFLTGDALTSTPNAGTVTFADGSNIYTTSPGAAHTFIANLVNSPSVSGNVTAGTGFIATTIGFTATAGNLALPSTVAGEASGEITFGGNRFVSNYGSANTFVGQASGNATLTTVDATDNTGLGFEVLNQLTTGEANTGFGDVSLSALTTGDFNVGLGCNSLIALTTGNNNTVTGYNAGSSYTGGESSNILIANTGTLGESNVIHIGTQGAGAGDQQDTYIAGIYAPNTALNATKKIMAVDLNGKLGGIANGTDGQVLIGSSAGSPAWGSFTAGANVTLTPGHNTLTIASTGGVAGGVTQVHTQAGTANELLADTSVTINGLAPLTTSGGAAGPGTNTVQVALTNGANGQVLIGGGAGASWANLTSADGSVTITNGANTISLTTAGGGGGLTQLNSVVNGHANGVAGVVNVVGNPVGAAPAVAGQNIYITGDNAHTMTISTNNSIQLPLTTSDINGTYLIGGQRFAHAFGGLTNAFLGSTAGNNLVTGTANTGVGGTALDAITTANHNTAIGYNAGGALNTGGNNTIVGYNAMDSGTNATFNTAAGVSALAGITTGQYNVALGYQAGFALATVDSSNIMIGNSGTAGTSNATIIGKTGNGNQQQTTCSIGGIISVASVGVAKQALVSILNTDRLVTLESVPSTLPMYNSVGNLIAGTLSSPDGSITVTPTTTGVNLTATVGAGQDAFQYVQMTNNISPFTAAISIQNYVLGYNAATGTGVALTKIFDRSGTSFANQTWTCPKAGIWSLSMSITFNNFNQIQFGSCSVVSPYIQTTNGASVVNYGIVNIPSPGYGGFVEEAGFLNGSNLTVTYDTLVLMTAGGTATFNGSFYLDNSPFYNVGIGPIAAFGGGGATMPPFAYSTWVSGFFVST